MIVTVKYGKEVKTFRLPNSQYLLVKGFLERNKISYAVTLTRQKKVKK